MMNEMNTNEKPTLFEQFGKLNFLMHRYHQMNHRQHGPMGDPHRGQGRVLTLLSLREEISQRDLLYLLDMRPQSLGELLSKLERGGYIERTPSEDDKRVMMVKITEAGKAASAETERPDVDWLFSCLTDVEREALSGYLYRIIAAIEAQPGMDERGEAAFFGRGRGGYQAGPGGEGPRGPFPGDDHIHGHGRGGFPGFGPDGMRRDGGFRALGARGGMSCDGRCGRDRARQTGVEGDPEQV